MKKWLVFYLLCALPAFQQTAGCLEPPRTCLLVTAFDDPAVLSSRESICKLADFAQAAGVNVIFMQVYRANQAWFPSKVADQGPYEACVKSVSQDPFALLISTAHRRGIKVYAWLNLLSLSGNKDAPILKKYGNEILTRNTKEKNKLEDYKVDNQYFLEPADTMVRKELAEIVEEILQAYPDLDGILFDYIRYPDVHPDYGYTRMNIERFKKTTGREVANKDNPAWQDWKRLQVTELLKELVAITRARRPDIKIGATGCVSYARAYNEAFQDWPSWINRGLVDFVTIMSYPKTLKEFEGYIAEGKEKVGDFRKVYPAIGAYKLGSLPEVFAQQLKAGRGSGAGACAIFHYESLLKNPALIQAIPQATYSNTPDPLREKSQ